jgi:ribosome-associated translation inhibitor RaiA
MKIKKLKLLVLRAQEHFQYFTLFKELVEETTAEALKIAPQFAIWLLLYFEEEGAFQKIPKSAFTEILQEADQKRDNTYRGMSGANRSAINHFKEDVKAAAERLQIVFDTVGNVTIKPQNEETTAIYNLIQILRSDKYTADVELVGLSEWIDELEANNQAYHSIDKERYEESADRNRIIMKDARAKVDEAYREIADRIDALYLIEGSEVYKNFIMRLNAVIEKYSTLIAFRKGSDSKDDMNDN